MTAGDRSATHVVRMTAHSPWEPDEGDVDPESSTRLIEYVMHVTSLWFPGSVLVPPAAGRHNTSCRSVVCSVTGNRRFDCTYREIMTLEDARRDLSARTGAKPCSIGQRSYHPRHAEMDLESLDP